MSDWTNKAWATSLPVYTQITVHPFITELMAGTLSQERFHFYLQQDALYLADFGKMLALIATRLPDATHSLAFLKFASETIEVERALHAQYLTGQQIAPNITHSPSCLQYVGALNRAVQLGTIEEALAAVLPCFWVYQEVGDYILANQPQSDNPYQDWINTYGGEDFQKSVKTAQNICNHYAAQTTEDVRRKMTAQFLLATKLEWQFWDSAYRLEKWAV